LDINAQKSEILRQLLERNVPTASEVELLSAADAVEQYLLQISGARTSFDVRLRGFLQARDAVSKTNLNVKLLDLWTRYLPLTGVLVAWVSKRRTIVGIAGIPGTGKTSFASILSAISNALGTATAVVSLDDFYLTPEVRKRAGFKWRALPGTHDLELLGEFLEEAKSASDSLLLPRYDTGAEVRLPPLEIRQPKLLLIEGWFVGADVGGYEPLNDSLDNLIYLDADLEWAHQSRLVREANIRKETGGRLGLSEQETEQFWREALMPGSLEWVLPLKERADLVVEIGNDYRIKSISAKTLAAD
jgi:pantothenate kinase-related protein Tda10